MLELIMWVNIIAALGLCSLFVYLYKLYGERYLVIWAASWGLFCLRIFLDVLRYQGYEQLLLLLINQLASISCALLLLYGIYVFREQKMPRGWLIVGVFATALTDVLVLLHAPIPYAAVPTAAFFGCAQIWTGRLFCRAWEIEGMGKLITGKAFMMIGFFNLTYPFTSDLTNRAQAIIFFSIGFALWIVIYNGILLVYFQKIRQELEESEKRFRLLAENARDMIYRFTFVPEPGFEYASSATYTILGYEPAELANDPGLWPKVFQEKDFKDIILNVQQWVFTDNKPLVLLLNRKDGHQIWTEQHIVPITDAAGNLIAIEGILRDIHERKRMEQEMMRLNQLNILGETAATIAHEIRNPMTTVHGFLQLLSTKENVKDYQDWFSVMIDELERANAIITDYLAFSKAENPQMKPRNLNCLIRAILPLLESNATLSSKHIKVEMGPVPTVELDEKAIRQLILNLSQNGLDSMEPGGTLLMRTYTEDETMVLAVSDEGKGMSREVLERLGTPFFTTKEKGTGLGLTVCYGIASLHRASIDVDTGAKGTTFSVRFRL